jgi:YVTN family beta-propeller protein
LARIRPVKFLQNSAFFALKCGYSTTVSRTRLFRDGGRAWRVDNHSKGGASVSDVNGREAAREVQIIESIESGAAPVVPVAIEIPVDNGPIAGIAVSPDGARLMVTNHGRDSVAVIDTETCRVVETIDVEEPFAIAIGGSGADRAYVSTASPTYDSIAVIDVPTNTVVATHPLALSVSDLAVDAEGNRVYVSRHGGGVADVAVLDAATEHVEVIDVVDVSRAPGATTQCVRVSPDGSRVYVGLNGPAGGRLVVLGTDARSDKSRGGRGRKPKKGSARSRGSGQPAGLRVIDTIAIGLPVRDVALSPSGVIAYVASCSPEVGVVLDAVDTRTNKITSTHKVGEIGGILTGLTLSADGDRAYLVSDANVTVLCTLTHDVIGTHGAASQPSCVVESPDGTLLYVADYSGTVSVTPVVSATPLAIECGEPASEVSTAWLMPDLVQPQPALA